jgi:hypothetical protein
LNCFLFSPEDSTWQQPVLAAPATPQQIRQIYKEKIKLPKREKLKEAVSLGSIKRNADNFEIPNFSKKLRTFEAISTSSTENLVAEGWRRNASWRRNTKSLTDKIVMEYYGK